MREVAAAVVAIVLVLCAVFIPVAFLGGIAGRLYQQFAVTVTIAVVISGLVALTLSPALCALLLKPSHGGESRLFRPFNRGFAWLSGAYLGGVRWMLRRSALGMAVLAVVAGLSFWLIRHVPAGFVPGEDMGYLYGGIVLPDGATLTRTGRVGDEVQKALVDHPAVNHVFVVTGFDLVGGGNKTNTATMFVALKPWSERKESSSDMIAYIFQRAAAIREGLILAFNAPPIRGLGTAAGFELYLQNRADSDPVHLNEVLQKFLADLRARSDLTGVTSFYRIAAPQIYVEVDREKASALGVPISEVFDALQGTMGSIYVNDFNKYGRTFRVQIQADAPYRLKAEDLGAVYVRSSNGDMLPLKALLTIKRVVGAEQLDRFNGFVAAKVIGGGAPGVSSGQAIAAVEAAAKSLPPGFAVEWSGQAFQEKRIGKAAIFAFAFAIVMAFLILAAQFERWTLPLAVLLSVPFAVLGALAAVLLRGTNNDIYFQIGLVVLIGLAAKNAILIVEFASQKQEEGLSVREAALEAARLRFRPIVMTSLAFVLGVLPLVLAGGAGAGARQSMGTGVFGGMLAATFIATLFVPLFYVLLTRERKKKP
jgi:hydrophobe/amphiphile efflux-1 (HAE1) family protein